MAHVMVLAAGRGTRLGALTEELPKPLVPVGDRPILRHICDALVALGQGEVVINTHHLPEHFAEFDPGAIQLRRVHEPLLRGTAGGVYGARALLKAPLVVYNADIWAAPPLGQLLAAAERAPISLLVQVTNGPGTVGLGEDGRVVRLRGERFGEEAQAADYVGIAALGEVALSALPEFGCLIGDLCLPWLRAGRPIATLPYAGKWDDLGTPEAYLALNLRWLAARSSTQDSSHVASGAELGARVHLSECVVGAGAKIAAGVTLSRCVVWPGAVVHADTHECILTTRGRVVKAAQS
ncbi:MAG: hypothetical protein RJA70_4120 [Pseudomonadota bacterium]|jgi:mannose-1-phosphate guanylyltransferase